MNNLKSKIDIAAKRKKASLVLKNCKIVNVFSGEIIDGDIAIDGDEIIAVGKNYSGIEEIDVQNKFVCPGFIDSHVHIESSMLTPQYFAQAVLPHGTTTVIADPHEIANVCGLDGIKFILEDSLKSPLDVFVMLPSCVPAVDFEKSGAILDSKELSKFINYENVLGLGEFMNYPDIINGEQKVLDKILVGTGKIIDGHAPNIFGSDLSAYVIAGIKTDHECSNVSEMEEKIEQGMFILIREGSVTKDLKALVKGVTNYNMKRCLFCTDDRHSNDILEIGHIDNNVRLAICEGMNPITAIIMATLNAAECYGLKNYGAIAGGYKADLIIFDDLEKINIKSVYKNGKKVAENNKITYDFNINFSELSKEFPNIFNTVNIGKISKDNLQIKIENPNNIAKVIGVSAGTVVTEKLERKVKSENNYFVFDNNFDDETKAQICKIVAVERYTDETKVGVGLIEGYKIKNGAIAQTISHDSHNIIAVGDNDEDLLLAIKSLDKVGGICLVSQGKVLKNMPLPIAGLLADKSIFEVSEELAEIKELAENVLEVDKNFDPFLSLGFMGLPVIPSLKITTNGLFDVDEFKFVEVSGR